MSPENTITQKKELNIDKLVFRIAGSLVLISVLLSRVHSAHWLWFTAFIGFNMLQSSFTGFCPSAAVFKLFGMKPGRAYY